MTDLAFIEWIEFLKLAHNRAKLQGMSHVRFYSYCSMFIQEKSIESIKNRTL